jgi:hypothetical protein
MPIEPSRAPLPFPKKEIPEEVQSILEVWNNILWGPESGKRMSPTKDDIEAAIRLARCGATEQDIRKVREKLLGQKDGWWKERGVRLKDVANHFDLAAPDVDEKQSTGKIPVPISRPNLERFEASVAAGQPVYIELDDADRRRLSKDGRRAYVGLQHKHMQKVVNS